MDISQWGGHFWQTMHVVTYAYPENPTPDDKKKIEDFFVAISHVLPCDICRTHFSKMLIDYPLSEVNSSRTSLTRWLIDRHNAVNARIGKPIVSYDEIDNKYHCKPGASFCTSGELSGKKYGSSDEEKSKKQPIPIMCIFFTAAVLFAIFAIIIFFAKIRK